MDSFSYAFLFLAMIFASTPVSPKPISLCEALKSNCNRHLMFEAGQFNVRYRQCLLEQLEENSTEIWNRMPQAIQSCLERDQFSKYFDISHIGGPQPSWLMKSLIFPPSVNSSCTVVLMREASLSNNNTAEKQLVNQFPQCDLHTVGSWYVSIYDRHRHPGGKIYESFLDTYDPPEGVKIGPVPIPPVEGESYGQRAKLSTILDKAINIPQVDYLWIEEEIMIMLGHVVSCSYPGHLLFQEPVNTTICQIDIVTGLFNIPEVNKFNQFARTFFPEIIKSIVKNSPFLPVRSRFDNSTGKMHTFYFNPNPYCLKKFLVPKCFANFACHQNLDLVMETKVIIL